MLKDFVVVVACVLAGVAIAALSSCVLHHHCGSPCAHPAPRVAPACPDCPKCPRVCPACPEALPEPREEAK